MATYRGERRAWFQGSRLPLLQLPAEQYFEIPGRPHVVYVLKNYHSLDSAAAKALEARQEFPFLFKAFETGQIGPKRMAKISGGKPRTATIHEYLDWTVTGATAEADDELDFGGFIIVLVYPRYRSLWPAPEMADIEGDNSHPQLSAPGRPLPPLSVHSRPVSAATIRLGPGFMEVPFVATKETHRGRGFCRALLEAIETVSRACGVTKLLLCSTNDPNTQSTWRHMGFSETSDADMAGWGYTHTDLVHMENTTQMHKDLPATIEAKAQWKPVVIKHQWLRQRTYVPVQRAGAQLVLPPAKLAQAANGCSAANGGGANSVSPAPAELPTAPGPASTACGRPEADQVKAEQQAQPPAGVLSAAPLLPLQRQPHAASATDFSIPGHPGELHGS